MNEKPEFKRYGDWHLFLWHGAGYGIGFEHLYESGGDLHAEITVQALKPADGRSHVTWEKLNLSSGQSRDRLAGRLCKQTGIDGWRGMLEYACVTAGREYRKGEPVIDLAEVESSDEVQYLIQKLCPLGAPTLMFADGDSMKSFLALSFALSVRTGCALPCGLAPTQQAAVLYLDWETSKEEMSRRLRWLATGFGIAVPHIHYRRMVRPLADDISRIRSEVDKLEIGFVVLDSAALATGGEPKETEPVLAMLAALRSLAPATCLTLAHVSKATAADRGPMRGRAYGNVMYENLGRSVWELRAAHDGDTHYVAFFHRKVNLGRGQQPFALRLDFDDAQHSISIHPQSLQDVPELAEHSTLAERLLWLLKRGAREVGDMAENTGEDPRAVRSTLSILAKQGKVLRLDENAKGGRGKEGSWGLPTIMA